MSAHGAVSRGWGTGAACSALTEGRRLLRRALGTANRRTSPTQKGREASSLKDSRPGLWPEGLSQEARWRSEAGSGSICVPVACGASFVDGAVSGHSLRCPASHKACIRVAQGPSLCPHGRAFLLHSLLLPLCPLLSYPNPPQNNGGRADSPPRFPEGPGLWPGSWASAGAAIGPWGVFTLDFPYLSDLGFLTTVRMRPVHRCALTAAAGGTQHLQTQPTTPTGANKSAVVAHVDARGRQGRAGCSHPPRVSGRPQPGRSPSCPAARRPHTRVSVRPG